jgi:dCMP deaminase
MKKKFKQAFMDCAITFSGLSSAVKAQVGSIIVKDNRIISIGYNGMPSGWSNVCEDSSGKTNPEVLHAEANAITKVAKSPESCEGAAIFCTHMPCIECAKLIHQCGIIEVYYNIDYNSAKGSGLKFLVDCGIYMEQV